MEEMNKDSGARAHMAHLVASKGTTCPGDHVLGQWAKYRWKDPMLARIPIDVGTLVGPWFFICIHMLI